MNFEARAEAGVAQKLFDTGDEVDHAVGIEEEHGDDGGDKVEVAPSQMTTRAMIVEVITAVLGSVGLPILLAKKRGTTRSRAMACRVRGAAKMLPKAEDKVEAQTPARMRTGKTAMDCMARLSLSRLSRLAWVANQITTRM